MKIDCKMKVRELSVSMNVRIRQHLGEVISIERLRENVSIYLKDKDGKIEGFCFGPEENAYLILRV